jgi:SAM-dependent methyltransferase
MSACIVCSGTHTSGSFYPKLSFNSKIFEYRKCTRCRTVYLVPGLTSDDTQKLYDTGYHEEFYFKEGPGKNKTYQAKLLKQYRPGGSFLDYGCGDAWFLNVLEGKEYELYGAEYNSKLVEKLKDNHPGIRFLSVAEIDNNKDLQFDIIHLCDVMGQVADPMGMIRSLRLHLRPGGFLFIESPVEHNFHFSYLFRAGYLRLRKLLNPNRVVPGKPFRVMFTNRRNQELFFKNAGFKTIHYEMFEWAYPFPDFWKDAHSLRQKIEYVIGMISKFISRMIPSWGNRFYYLGTPDEVAEK